MPDFCFITRALFKIIPNRCLANPGYCSICMCKVEGSRNLESLASARSFGRAAAVNRSTVAIFLFDYYDYDCPLSTDAPVAVAQSSPTKALWRFAYHGTTPNMAWHRHVHPVEACLQSLNIQLVGLERLCQDEQLASQAAHSSHRLSCISMPSECQDAICLIRRRSLDLCRSL